MEKSLLNNNNLDNMDVDEGESDEGLEQDFSLDDLNPQNLPIDFEDDDDEDEDEDQLTIGSPENQARRALYGAGIDEIASELPIGKKKKKGGKRGPRSKLPPHLARIMGEANLAYASQEFQRAIELLHEVVKQNPNVSDPYHTLGLIHEEMGQNEKAAQFFMIAAHLTRKDASLWRRVAMLSKSIGNISEAVYCYTKALKLEPDDLESLYQRALLYEETGEHKKATESLQLLLKQRPNDPEVSKELAKLYHATQQTDKAVAVLEETFKNNEQLDLDLVNMLAELLMGMGHFDRAQQVINQAQRRYTTATLPLDLTVNYGICQAYLGNLTAAARSFDKLMEQDVQAFGDLFYSVAETYAALGDSDTAISYYEELIKNEQYNQPAVWAKIARCYKLTEKWREAVNYYRRVCEALPDNLESCLALIDLYKQLKDNRAALEVADRYLAFYDHIAATGQEGERDLRVPVLKFMMHYELGEYDECLAVSMPILGNADLRPYEKRIRKKGDGTGRKGRKKAAESEDKTKKSKKKEHVLLGESDDEEDEDKDKSAHEGQGAAEEGVEHKEGETVEQVKRKSIVDYIGSERYYHLVSKSSKVLVYFDRYREAFVVMKDALDFIRNNERVRLHLDHLHQLKHQGAKIACHLGEYTVANEWLRAVCTNRPHNMALWNLFYQVMTKLGRWTYSTRWMLRLRARHPDCAALWLLTAHHALTAGSLRLALADYSPALRLRADAPLPALAMAITLLSLSTSRRQPDRNGTVMQAFAFFAKYVELTNRSQEAVYNLARASQGLGLRHFAVELYEEVLAWKDEENSESLKREAAYNLSLIYQASGNLDLARQVLRDHITI